jgi:hypothetical protein
MVQTATPITAAAPIWWLNLRRLKASHKAAAAAVMAITTDSATVPMSNSIVARMFIANMPM